MKVKKLMVGIPRKLGIPFDAEKRMSKAFELLFNEAGFNKELEFRRLGNSLKDCEDRLDCVFSMIDGAVEKHSGDKAAGLEAKRLLLLASTPDENEQKTVLEKYGDDTLIYSELMTTSEAVEVGLMSWWNH